MPKPIHLRVLRDRAKLSQTALARRSGIAQNTISKLETHHVEPGFATVVALARALDVDPRDICFGPVEGEAATKKKTPAREAVRKPPKTDRRVRRKARVAA